MPGMNILSFFRRTKSRYADDKAVDDFARVAEQTGILDEQQNIDELAKLISGQDNPSAEEVERLCEILSGSPRR